MKIVQINATSGSGSTGKICVAVSQLLNERGIENYILYSLGKSDYEGAIKFASKAGIKLGALRSRLLGNYGFGACISTSRLISRLKKIKPDVVHIHNIHSHDVNVKRLFAYLKKHPEIKVYYTFHDCWAFTGYCPHFDMVECDKWETGCEKCPTRKQYSWLFDRSKGIFEKKKRALLGVDFTVITPSRWLADRTKRSFLKDKEVKVINNGIDLSVFKPTESDFREKYKIGNKNIVLGVAFGWSARKGLDAFLELSRDLSDEYQIVLVGTNSELDKGLPENIISIHKTANQEELAKIYTAADVLVNPTREETYPTVNMEALACGTPVITFKTGGSPEIIDEKTGIVVDKNDIIGLESAIIKICEGESRKSACLERARQFDQKERFIEYLSLYK